MTKKLREQRRERLLELITQDGRTRLAGVSLAARLLHVSTYTVMSWLKPETSTGANPTPEWAIDLLQYKLADEDVVK